MRNIWCSIGILLVWFGSRFSIEGHEVFGFFLATLGIISIYIDVNYTACISLFLLWFGSGIVMKGYVWMGYLMGLIGAVFLFYLVDSED